jgi:hypothetical protein
VSRYGLQASVGALSFYVIAFAAIPASAGATAEAPPEADSPWSAAERQSLRQDVEHMQQNFYQASPEERRRWIEAVRERRLHLDAEEDRAALSQTRIRKLRPAPPELARSAGTRNSGRERIVE